MKYLGSEKHLKIARDAQKLALEKLEELRIERIINYEKNPNKCTQCGLNLQYERKNNKFCSSSCAAKYNNKKRGKRNEKTKEKISKSLKLFYSTLENEICVCKKCNNEFEKNRNNKSKYCQNCRKKNKNNDNVKIRKCGTEFTINKLKSGRYSATKYCSDTCRNNTIKNDTYRECGICKKKFKVIRLSNYNKSRAKFCSEECRNEHISREAKKRIKNGTHNGWNSRNIISYPEKFFVKVLKNNNIEFEHNYPIKQSDLGIDSPYNFFLDFYIKSKNIDLEIDGKQHERREEKDKIRDEALTKNGYNVYRIKWKRITTKNGKKYIKGEIDKFIEYYKSL